MSKRLMPTYLVNFLKEIYDGEIPSNFGKRMVSRQFIARVKDLYDSLGGENPSDYSRRMVNEYLIKFFDDIEIVEFDDDDISQTKTVPGNLVYPACRIDSIGGMSYKSENLITTLNENTGTSHTFVDGVLTSTSVDSRSWNVYSVCDFQVYLTAGTYYFQLFDVDIDGSDYQAVAYCDSNNTSVGSFSLPIYTGKSITISTAGYYGFMLKFKGTLKPMLVTGSTAPTVFKEGFTGIRDSAVTAVKSYGANLITNTDYTLGGDAYNATITFTKQLQVGTTYTLSYDSSILSNVTLTNATLVSDSGYVSRASIAFTPTSNNVVITFAGGSTSNNLRDKLNNMVWFMLNYGSTALPYTPYRGLLDTYTVPSAITSLEGYGQGIDSTVYNNVDFASGKYVKKVGVVDLGSLTWVDNVSGYGFKTASALTPAAFVDETTQLFNGIMSDKDYTIVNTSEQSIGSQDKWIGIGRVNQIIFCKDESYTNATEFKAAMDGVLLYYELATPTETNITENSPLLEVEEGGRVVLENEYNQDVPSEVVTWIKES